MLSFLHIRIYKKMFLRYLFAIVMLFITASCIAIKMQYDDQLKRFSDVSLEAFSRAEHEMDKYTAEEIDDYISKLYANNALFSDFLGFLTAANAEDYNTKHLPQAEDTSFISDLKLFVRTNDYVVSKVIFKTPNVTKDIGYYDNHSPDFRFSVSADQLNVRYDDISYGYLYIKRITDPQNYSIDLGQVIFVMNTNKILSAVKQYDIDSVCAVSQNGILHLAGTVPTADDKLLSFYQQDDTQQIIRSGLFSRTYCYIHTSSRYDYKLVTAESSAQIIKKCFPSFLFTVLLILSVCIMITAVTVLNIQKDSRMLTQIITFIDYASNGDFSEIELKEHNDEYFLIANKLNKMGKDIKMYIEHEYLFKLDQQKAEMKALQNQINPHFLYNTLEIIRYRALRNSDPEVSDAIENLGSLYRSIVKSENVITLDRELSILQQYLKLMQFRYSDNFCYQINVPENIRQLLTVKFWMQPVVENFFKYGFDKTSEYNVFFVVGYEKGGFIYLELSNNGCPISADRLKKINDLLNKDGQEQTTESIGLQNVYRRLRFFYGESLSMKISNSQPYGVTTTIRFSRDAAIPNQDIPANSKGEK